VRTLPRAAAMKRAKKAKTKKNEDEEQRMKAMAVVGGK
jgi:hypothetical protein